ncbi:chromosome segregation protein SMC [Roseibium album]|nr:chromosome segregation protein SMC [Roseibium album]
MLTGRQTLGTIEQSREDLRREEAELSKRIERSTRALTDLQERQSEAYRDLARFRLDTDAAGALNTRLDSAAREARRLLDKRSADYKVLTEQLRQCESERIELQKRRLELDSSRDAAENQMDELMEAVDDRLEKDSSYLAQRLTTERALATAEAAATKAATSDKDRQQKGQAYEADPLFIYLWQRGFGTQEYDRRGLIRSLDRWVSGLIRYQDARANYTMLTSIPERMARHAERCNQTAQAEQQKLAEFSRNAMTDAAGTDLVGTIEVLSEEIDQIDNELDGLDRRIETLSSALAEFSSGEDADFQKAEEHLSVSLQSDNLNDLWRAALDTPSPEDEKIVQRIEDLRERIEQVAREIRQDRELQRDVSRRRAELADVIKRFRSKGYGSWESTFSDDKLTTVLLGELVKGAITGADYWARAERSHKRRKPRGRQVAFPDGSGLPKSMGGFGGFGGSHSGSSGSSDSFGGGGFKSGGGFGGGGFKTGDQF